MFSNHSLAFKLNMTVIAPVMINALFITVLFTNMSLIEAQRNKEAHLKNIITRADDCLGNIYATVRKIETSALKHKNVTVDTYRKSVENFREDMKALRSLTRNDPTAQKYVVEADTKASRAFDLLNEIIEAAQSNPDAGSVDKMRAFMEHRQELQELSAQAFVQLRGLIKEQRDKAASIPPYLIEQENFNKALLILLFLSVGVAAIVCAFFLNTNVVKRIGVVVENIGRFKESKELKAPLTGFDEVVSLDSHFHNMAEKLTESMRKERAAIDNSADVICSIGEDGLFTKVSPASEQVWKIPPETLLGKHFADIVPEGERSKAIQHFEQIKNNLRGTFESIVQRDDGSAVDMLWSAQFVNTERSVYAIAHDISERKEVERMKQEFVATVSHELRTPLTSVKGILALILAGAYGPIEKRGQSMITTAETEITRLMKLINELLEVAKMESGNNIELTLEKVPLESIVQRAVKSVSIFASQHEIAIEQGEIPDVFVHADIDRLVQVIINLTSNAVKFSPKGERVTIDGIEDGNLIELRITDKGRGIPESLCEAIFDRFKQVKSTDGSKKGGTGLGLAISKNIVERHGGQIGVSSKLGEGSTFWFRIPKKQSIQHDEPASSMVALNQSLN
jgi:PAS domain S-box-containing protein